MSDTPTSEEPTEGDQPGRRRLRLGDIQKQVDERMDSYGLTREDVGKIRSARDAGEEPDVPSEKLEAYERMAKDDRERLQETIAAMSKQLWGGQVEDIGKSIVEQIGLPKIEPIPHEDIIPLSAREHAPPIQIPDYQALRVFADEDREEREREAAEDRNREQMMLEATIELSRLTRQQNYRQKAQARLDAIAQRKSRHVTGWGVGVSGLAAVAAIAVPFIVYWIQSGG